MFLRKLEDGFLLRIDVRMQQDLVRGGLDFGRGQEDGEILDVEV